jgi:hypothetical protein
VSVSEVCELFFRSVDALKRARAFVVARLFAGTPELPLLHGGYASGNHNRIQATRGILMV